MSGVVLAGGASRRMRRDKATIEIDGETLLTRAVRCLTDAGAASVVVATGTAGRLGGLPWPEVDDGPHAGAGPLAGILAALRVAEAPVVALLAVDLPSADPAIFRWLFEGWRHNDRALVPVDADDRAQPLHGLVAATPGTIATLEHHLARGERRVQRVLGAMGARHVPVPATVAQTGWARNWNEPEIDPTPGGLGRA